MKSWASSDDKVALHSTLERRWKDHVQNGRKYLWDTGYKEESGAHRERLQLRKYKSKETTGKRIKKILPQWQCTNGPWTQEAWHHRSTGKYRLRRQETHTLWNYENWKDWKCLVMLLIRSDRKCYRFLMMMSSDTALRKTSGNLTSS